MKYTPRDIQRREFEVTFRGLNPDEVREFLREVASEWEELLQENQELKNEVYDMRERVNQYKEQDRIFKETLMQAQKTREEMMEVAQKERELILKEARFQGEEIAREAQEHVARLEAHLRNLKLERVRFLQDMDALAARTKRFLSQEAPEMFPPADITRRLD
ncbi:MAG: DivIVA domain-containing protein [Holophagales bacterium]|jgi:cell division initiation protein|nr:DivIVA domain-containing protein [Holophagales bacterium]